MLLESVHAIRFSFSRNGYREDGDGIEKARPE
jgi:hypothetical protein